MSFLNRDLISNIFRTGMISLAIRVVGVILSLVVSMILARLLGPGQYGAFSFVLSIILLFSVPVQMGLPQLIIRETAKVEISEKWGEVYSIWVWSTICVLIISSLVVISTYALVYFGEGIIPKTLELLFLIGVFLVPFLSLGRLRDSAIRGLHFMIQGQLIDSIIKPCVLLSGVLFFIIFDYKITPSLAMLIHVGAVCVAFLSGSIILRYLMPDELLSSRNIRFKTSKWIAIALPLGLFSALYVINTQVDLIMLGVLASMEDVGVYKVVMSLAALIGFGLQVVNTVVGPQFSRLYAKGDLAMLERLFRLSIKITVCMAIPAVFVYVFFGKHILMLLFGESFVVGYFSLVILVVGQLLNSIIGSVGLLLNMTGYVRDSLLAGICGIIVNVVLNFSLIPDYGMEGAALSNVVALVVCNFYLSFCVRRRLGISPPAIKVFSV